MDHHRPGLPEDLPAPATLWARWALLAVLTAREEDEDLGIHRTGNWITEDTLHLDDCGTTRWWLTRSGEDRWVLYGEDEASRVKWHKPAIDMLAGAPDWLPYEDLRDLIEGYELGCVYWWENGAWARAPYPDTLDDDGLDCGMSRFSDQRGVFNEMISWELLDGTFDEAAAGPLLADAEQYRLTPERLEELVTATPERDWDLPAMLRALRRTGLSGQESVRA
ncbi:hypothetical protein GCM10018793_21580 [Streptomyces sulfonofaciens]|uniref:Uncharacterized protein n=1 Tax=Streptomyces sulfonofaciens TaxID=68272 RepID=A0A919KYG6_9ACTN|nr:hypothetical protein [Streptomyces sulfonofaciens]GHH76286.1 hypothetical protein GCM10018793_21580 [Streptomyces sulfonofaciens]